MTAPTTKNLATPTHRPSSGPPSPRDLLIAAFEAGVDDPADAAAKVLAELDDDGLQEMALAGLHSLALKLISAARGAHVPGEPPPARPSKYQRYGKVQLVCVDEKAGTWKPLDDCTADELDAIADAYEARAARNTAKAAEYRQMATAMRKAKARTWGSYVRKTRKAA